MNECSKITRKKRLGGEKQFKLRSENPPKQPWRGKTSADNTRFPVKTILAGNRAHAHDHNHKCEPQTRQSYQQTKKKVLTHFENQDEWDFESEEMQSPINIETSAVEAMVADGSLKLD